MPRSEEPLECSAGRGAPLRVAAAALAASFVTYLCMYGVRKPFTAAAFEGDVAAAIALPQKEALLVAQVIGYAVSKFWSVRFCAEISARRRARAIVAAVACAELALLALPLLPRALQPLALFLNGLPLGLVWGLVFAYLEGRRTSDLLGVGLSVSFILGSGVARSAGRALLDSGVPEAWMPCVAGLLYLPFVCLGVAALERLPPPDAKDVAERSARAPMERAQRRAFLEEHRASLLPLCALFFFLTAYREYRDSLQPEILAQVAPASALSFTWIEGSAALGALLGLGALAFVRDSRRAVFATYAAMGGGAAAIGVATLAHRTGCLGGSAWMAITGAGLYVAYVPFGSILFDRWMAVLRSGGNALFAIALTDALGYLGAVLVLLAKPFVAASLSRYEFFCALSYVTSLVAVIGFALSARAFARRLARA
jgi:hypothetical protein